MLFLLFLDLRHAAVLFDLLDLVANAVVIDFGVFQPHVLGHGPFSPIRLVAVGHLADELPLDLACAPPHPLLLLLVGLLLSLLKFLYPLGQLYLLLGSSIELGGEHGVSEVQLIDFFEKELGCALDVALELGNMDWLVFGKFLLVPLWISFVFEPLALERRQVHLFLLHHKLN